MEENFSVFWFRRDLRLDDNLGLNAALSSGLKVIPIFIFDTEIINKLEKNDLRIKMIHAALVKLNDDGLQIIEQILPFFQPSYNMTIKLVDAMEEFRDVPVVLNSVNYTDDYEGSMDDRKLTLFTLQITAKTYIFGPVGTSSPIKKAKVDYHTEVDLTAPRRVSYQVTPKALEDKNKDATTELAGAITKRTLVIEVLDSTNIPLKTYIEIGNEVMYVKSKPATNKLGVRRAQRNTTAAEAVAGTPVDLINAADDALLDSGDDFGFNEMTSFYG